jgi:DeoR/GlpR family transcriptional regulator of sugar metabolism
MRKKADEEAAARKRAEEERERERKEAEKAAQKVYTHMCIYAHTCMNTFIRLSIPLC